VCALHLQHGDSKYHKRNQDLEKIRRESKIPIKNGESGARPLFIEPIDKRADLVVLMGDMNYRVDGLKEDEVKLAMLDKRYNVALVL
jgi:hypothetical protein